MQSNKAAGNGEDRLSELPNDVLLNILERVGTLDAVKTCILSKQMQKLPAMLSQIVIDLSSQDLIQMDGVVADMTEKILSTRSPQIPIRNLKLRFNKRGGDNLKIGRAVALAMATHDRARPHPLTHILAASRRLSAPSCAFPSLPAPAPSRHVHAAAASGNRPRRGHWPPLALATCRVRRPAPPWACARSGCALRPMIASTR